MLSFRVSFKILLFSWKLEQHKSRAFRLTYERLSPASTFISYFQDRVLLTLTVLNEKDPGKTWKLRYPKEEHREVVSEPLNLICHIQPMCSDFPVLLIHLVVPASGTRAALVLHRSQKPTPLCSSAPQKDLASQKKKSGNQGGKRQEFKIYVPDRVENACSSFLSNLCKKHELLSMLYDLDMAIKELCGY